MLVQAILVGLVGAFGCLDYQLGTLYAFRPIVLCPLVGLVLGDLQTGLAVGASLELLFMGSISIGAYVPPNETVGGIAMAMEEKVARGEIEPESVNDVKAALMGPLSGIGDSIFLSTLRVVAAAVGISLCQAGNPFGPIAFLLIYNVPGFALRVWGAVKGYELGVGFLDEAQRTGLMQKIMTCVGIVGVMVVGAMCKDMFWASIPVAIGSGEDAQTLQDILDGIMPGMLGMIAFWLYYWLLSKKINPMVLIVATMVVGIIGAFFGVLA